MTLQQLPLFARPDAPPARRNLVIEAGAGTGKTTAIVAEVLKLMLENEELAPERIVLVTFTEKAAGEIADRIREALERLEENPVSWPPGSPNPLVTITDVARAKRAIARHLANIDALRSQTIHSFCQSLLRQFPIEARLDPQFKIIEGFERSLLYGQLYDAWVDEETRTAPTAAGLVEWEFLLAHVGYLFMIRDIVFSLLERRDLIAVPGYDLGDLSEVEPALFEALQTIRGADLRDVNEDAAKLFAYIQRTPPPERGSIESWIDYLSPIATLIRDANLPRKPVELKEALKTLRAGDKGRSMYDRLTSHRAATALMALAGRFIAFLDREKRKLGVVDFDDLLLRTQIVLDDPDVVERARAQFDYLFVDEFQDTDRTQANIIRRLARGRDGELVPGKTIVVGDPKQSIYGFRRADPETYDRMTQELIGAGAERRVIVDQYRSDPPLLDAVNTLFSRLFPPQVHDPNVFRPAYHTLRAGKRHSQRELDARITMLHAEHEERNDRFFGEAEAIAEWILARREEGNDRDLQRFAILFRRLTKIDDYLDTLDRYGIDYVLPPTRLFLDRRAPVDLLAVLRGIAYPFDKGAEVSAARTPYFALTDEEILAGAETYERYLATLESYRAAAQQLTVSELIDVVVQTSGIEAIYDAAADGERSKRHLSHLRAIAFEYDRKIGGSVRQFVDEITRRRAEPDEMEPSLVDESKNAVRILSVHAAKGLEFETVILPDLAFNTTNADVMQLFTVDEPPCLVMGGRAESISGNFRYANGEKLKKISGAREEAETRRLFYVAVTRAKTDVVFVMNAAESRNSGFMKCLLEAFGVTKDELAGMWGDGRIGKTIAEIDVAFERMSVRETAARIRRRLRDRELEARLALEPLADPALTAPPLDEPLPPARVASLRAGNAHRAAGVLLHRILERWDGITELEPLVARLAAEQGVDGEELSRVRRRLGVIARSPMMERIARAESVGRELPIRFADEQGAILERRIDRVIRESGIETVIDYKSGKPDDDRLARDREQVLRYCRAVSAMTGRPCRGLLWYVDLEHDQVVAV